MYATFRYHPVLAPEGRKFTDDAKFDALGPEWVDTPAKFPVVVGPDAPSVTSSNEPIEIPLDPPIVKRGRKPKEVA